jgi:hypothetical protein
MTDTPSYFGVENMVCKYCEHRFISSDSEFRHKQGNAYRGRGCYKLGPNPKPDSVMNGGKCNEFELDEKAKVLYPMWEQRSLVLKLIQNERWDELENGENEKLERAWVEVEKVFGSRDKYVGTTIGKEEATYEQLKEWQIKYNAGEI